MTTDALTTIEAERLEALEHIIERNLGSFIDVGLALSRIKDERLYRLTHANFDDYTRDRWGMSRQRADQLIRWKEVDADLTTVVVKPETERQARELAKVEPEQREEVWTAAQVEFETPQPTANEIKQVREKRQKPVDGDLACDVEDMEQRIFDAVVSGALKVWVIDQADFTKKDFLKSLDAVLANRRGIVDEVKSRME